MYDYQVYGSRLRSPLELEGLPAADPGSPQRWTLRPTDRLSAVDTGMAPLGSEPVGKDAHVSLRPVADGFLLEYDDTGTFHVTRGSNEIEWLPGPDVDTRALSQDVAGRVLSLALYLDGAVVLHASAAEIGGRTVAFLGSKGRGKSTTAYSLDRAGARVIADDEVPVWPGDPPMTWAGIPVMRLRPDMAELVTRRVGAANGGGSEKGHENGHENGRENANDDERPILQAPERTLHVAEGASSPVGPLPLGAAYLLLPESPDDLPRAKRERLPVTMAALALLGQAKLGPLLSGSAHQDLLRACTKIAESVPVYRLHYPTRKERIGDTAERILSWERSPAGAAAGSGSGP